MKSLFWTSFTILILGLVGVVANVFTGFWLTKNVSADADLHLTIALSAVLVLILGSIGLIRSSQQLIDALQEKLVLEKKDQSRSIASMTENRSRSVYTALSLIICSVINLISGTISQSGRFPIVHGLFGFVLLGITIASLVLWISVARDALLKD